MEISEELKLLTQKKEEIERLISEHGKTLEEEGNVGMKGNLIDAEGFPRNDIDIYKVRIARQQINCLQNDYKDLMVKLEEELNLVHSTFKEKSAQSNAENVSVSSNLRPFIKITHVDQESPSFEAGIRVDDEILQFGPFTHSTTDKNLSQIAQHVREKKDKIILLNVQRGNGSEGSFKTSVKIKLIPKQWSGHGTLGCKLVYMN